MPELEHIASGKVREIFSVNNGVGDDATLHAGNAAIPNDAVPQLWRAANRP